MASPNQTGGDFEFLKQLADKFNNEEFSEKELDDFQMELLEMHENDHLLELEELRTSYDLAVGKLTNAHEKKMDKLDEHKDFITSYLISKSSVIPNLEKIARAESEKLEAIGRLERGKEVKGAAEREVLLLQGKDEEFKQVKFLDEQKVAELENEHNRILADISTIRECNSEIKIDSITMNEARKRAELNKLARLVKEEPNIVEKLMKLILRGS